MRSTRAPGGDGSDAPLSGKGLPREPSEGVVPPPGPVRGGARRRIVLVATCALCLVGADWLVRSNSGTFDRYYRSNIDRKAEVLTERPAAPPVICMGSSRAAYAFVPSEFERVTGRSAFNFGVPATKVIEWQLAADRWIVPASPELLILAVNASEIRADYAPVTAARELFDADEMFRYLREDGWSSLVLGHFVERRAGAAWGLYHRRFEILSFLQEQSGPVLPKHAQIAGERRLIASRKCPDDGFEHPWERRERLMTLAQRESASPGTIVNTEIPDYSPDAPAVRHFREFLSWLGRRRIRVIVAYLPNSPRAELRWGDAEIRLEATIADCCREAGIPYVSAKMAELPRTNEDFFDETHMGTGLARRLTRRIAERALAIGCIAAEPLYAVNGGDSTSPADARLPVDESNADGSTSDSTGSAVAMEGDDGP